MGDLNLNDLQAFLAVAECDSFSRAAERLHLTQPAVSKRIQALERALGCPLFDRVGKRTYLTDGGRLLRPRAEAVLRDLTDARGSSRTWVTGWPASWASPPRTTSVCTGWRRRCEPSPGGTPTSAWTSGSKTPRTPMSWSTGPRRRSPW